MKSQIGNLLHDQATKKDFHPSSNLGWPALKLLVVFFMVAE